jgi:hypothetical protein
VVDTGGQPVPEGKHPAVLALPLTVCRERHCCASSQTVGPISSPGYQGAVDSWLPLAAACDPAPFLCRLKAGSFLERFL